MTVGLRGSSDEVFDAQALAADSGGRILCLLLAIYAFAVFGNITAGLPRISSATIRTREWRRTQEWSDGDIRVNLGI